MLTSDYNYASIWNISDMIIDCFLERGVSLSTKIINNKRN